MRRAHAAAVAALAGAVLAGAGATAASATSAPLHGRAYPGNPTTEARLVQTEDERLLLIGSAIAKNDFGGGPHTMHIDGKRNLLLGARAAAYTLADLQRLLPKSFAKQSDGTYLLRQNVIVAPGATLDLHDSRPLVVHLASSAGGFVSIVDFGGKLRLAGSRTQPAEVNAWDAGAGRVDTDTTDGRAYIRVIAGSARVSDTGFTGMGFWSGTTGGFSLTGTRSATALGSAAAGSTSESAADASLVTATIERSSFDGDAYGLFVTGARDVHVSDSAVGNSLVDGLVFHRYVTRSSVIRTTSTTNAVDGFRLSRGSSGTALTDVTATGNGYNGVTVDGSPLADGPSATGLDTKVYGNSTVTDSRMVDNAHNGIQVLGGSTIRLTGNRVAGSPTGIVTSGEVAAVRIEGNRVSRASDQGIALRDGATAADVSGNRVSGSPIGIYLRNSVASVTDNVVTGSTSHGIGVVGRAAGTVVRHNTLVGIGPSSVDVGRTSHVTVRANAVKAWTTTQTLGAFLRSKFQPLTVLWLVLGLLVLVTAGGALRQRRRGFRHPYPDHAPLAQIAGDPVDPASLGLPSRAPARRTEVTS